MWGHLDPAAVASASRRPWRFRGVLLRAVGLSSAFGGGKRRADQLLGRWSCRPKLGARTGLPGPTTTRNAPWNIFDMCSVCRPTLNGDYMAGQYRQIPLRAKPAMLKRQRPSTRNGWRYSNWRLQSIRPFFCTHAPLAFWPDGTHANNVAERRRWNVDSPVSAAEFRCRQGKEAAGQIGLSRSLELRNIEQRRVPRSSMSTHEVPHSLPRCRQCEKWSP